MILFWILAILAIVWLLRSLDAGGFFTRRGDGGAAGEDRAVAILRERYARGEIDGEEFERRLHDLQRPKQV